MHSRKVEGWSSKIYSSSEVTIQLIGARNPFLPNFSPVPLTTNTSACRATSGLLDIFHLGVLL